MILVCLILQDSTQYNIKALRVEYTDMIISYHVLIGQAQPRVL